MTPPAAAAAPVVRPRRPTAPVAPRRVSGPARRTPAAVPAAPARSRRAGGDPGLLLGLIASLEGLAQHRLIDRLIRGRIWIALIAFALLGIVTLQLGLLRLNGGIGRALEHQAMLQRENAALSIENSELAASERILPRATRLGMYAVPSGGLRFLGAHPAGDATKAATALSSSARATSESAETASSSGAAESAEASEGESGEAETTSAETSGEASASSAPAGETSESGESSSDSESAAATSEASSSSSEAAAAGGAETGSQGE